MKKLILLPLTLALLFGNFLFSSCSKDNTDITKIALTTKNYQEYLAVNVYISDYSSTIYEQTETATFYTITCVVTISTLCLGDYQFENAKIEYSKCKSPVSLGYNGSSATSFVYTDKQSRTLTPPATLTATDIVKSIEGYVLISKE